MHSATQLITAIAALVGAVAWPAVLLFVLIRFRTGLSEFVQNLGEFSFKAPGLEATARRQQIEAAVAVGAALVKSSGDGSGSTEDPSLAAARLAEALPDRRAQENLQGALVLWVDDRPDNNRFERQALEALGVRFVISTSTDDAVNQLARQKFDLVISDMGRPPDPRAGYTLLDRMRQGRDDTPFIIYASSRAPEHIQEARSHGAVGCTNSPQELIGMVTQALRTRRRR
jgi:CheY-like chemotaxis protein